MGRIEEHWTDVTIFTVEFVSITKDGTKRRHRKNLVFDSFVSKEEVFQLIPKYLMDVERILHVDEIGDALYLKE